jgi:hypothetical protein
MPTHTCTECGQVTNTPGIKTRLNTLNETLYRIGLRFWDNIPFVLIESALWDNGFKLGAYNLQVDDWLEQKRQHTDVGEGKWLTATFTRMGSGRWEVVAYVN